MIDSLLESDVDYLKSLKIIVSSRIWIPAILIRTGFLTIRSQYLEGLKKTLFDEVVCSKCPNRYKRPCTFCKNCKALLKTVNLCGYRNITFEENPGIEEYFCLPLDCLRDIQDNGQLVFEDRDE